MGRFCPHLQVLDVVAAIEAEVGWQKSGRSLAEDIEISISSEGKLPNIPILQSDLSEIVATSS